MATTANLVGYGSSGFDTGFLKAGNKYNGMPPGPSSGGDFSLKLFNGFFSIFDDFFPKLMVAG
ncbi:hypothetical protein [Endozoicomonas sp.]|uniref:hypothetical protein n=1 Tax=Endozoicomonas sp. TaxID=1892382 RepID=UPI002888E1A2|nr:hypothetical protein [Endozoicomonas sp.]